jgi:hypothetical protein
LKKVIDLCQEFQSPDEGTHKIAYVNVWVFFQIFFIFQPSGVIERNASAYSKIRKTNLLRLVPRGSRGPNHPFLLQRIPIFFGLWLCNEGFKGEISVQRNIFNSALNVVRWVDDGVILLILKSCRPNKEKAGWQIHWLIEKKI